MGVITITNLLTYGGFEGTGWSVGSYDTTHVKYGTKSLKLTGTTVSNEIVSQHSSAINLNNTHLYYVRWEVYHEGAPGTTGCYFGIAEPSFKEGLSLGPANQWNVKSAVNNRSSFASGLHGLRFDYNNSRQSGSIWIDGAMCIDLTESFGAGNEPSASWCDFNIPFFIGTRDCYFPKQLNFLSIGLNPTVATVGSSVIVTVEVTDYDHNHWAEYTHAELTTKTHQDMSGYI